jgi:hypothetical protein
MTMRTVGELVEAIRSQDVTLELTQADKVRYVGPTMSAFYLRALRLNRDSVKHILRLERRLHTGWIRCEAQADPIFLDQYETHWNTLLKKYEEVCDAPQLIDEQVAA